MSTATERPSRVVTVPVTAAVCSDGEKVNSASPVPKSFTKPAQSKPKMRTVRKSWSMVVTPDSASSSWPAITCARVVNVDPSPQVWVSV
jgi:hypothetical protein